MMPVGLEAVACSMIRAISAMSPVDGLRYSTFTPRSCSAFFRAFLIVFHHESESGAWLTKTKRSLAACAEVIAPAASGRLNAAAKKVLRKRPKIIDFLHVESVVKALAIKAELLDRQIAEARIHPLAE